MSEQVEFPRFINAQPSPVRVYDESKRSVSVGCFPQRFQQSDGTFVLEGHYWRRFLHPAGPLSPYPAGDKRGFTKTMVLRDTNAQRVVDNGDAPDSFRPKADAARPPVASVAKVADPGAKAPPVESTPPAAPVATEAEDPADEDLVVDDDDADTDEDEITETAPDADDDSDEEGDDDPDEDVEEVEINVDQIRSMKKNELIELAKANGIPHGGTVADLRTRIESRLFGDDTDEE